MGSERTTPAQFNIIVSYMEQNGDINNHATFSDRLEGGKKWIELSNILNNKAHGEPKPIEKWRKCWSDFKNNTKKKANKILKNMCQRDLSPLEKRVLKLMETNKQVSKRKTSESDNESTELYKMEAVLVEEEPCGMLEMPPTPASPAQSIKEIQYELIDHKKHRESSTSSSASVTSSEDTPPPRKRKKSLKDITDVADKYLKFEREREKMAHEREMARIKQNDQLIAIFGKVVNVLEALSPTAQKNLDERS